MPIVDVADVVAWADLDLSTEETETMTSVVAAVEAALTLSHDIPDAWPADVRQAVIMQAARLWKRRTTIEGVTSFGQDFAIRVNRFDPDIDSLLAPYVKWVCA